MITYFIQMNWNVLRLMRSELEGPTWVSRVPIRLKMAVDMLKKRIASFKYAFKGIHTLFCSEPNAWIHLTAAILVIIAGFYFKISTMEWILLVLCIVLVFAAEAFNTSIEKLTDLASPDFHPKAKITKDTAAAAVLIISIGAAIIGIIIFLPRICKAWFPHI